MPITKMVRLVQGCVQFRGRIPSLTWLMAPVATPAESIVSALVCESLHPLHDIYKDMLYNILGSCLFVTYDIRRCRLLGDVAWSNLRAFRSAVRVIRMTRVRLTVQRL